MPSVQNTFNACMMHLCSSTAFNVPTVFNVPSQHGKIFTENNYNIDYIQSPHEF